MKELIYSVFIFSASIKLVLDRYGYSPPLDITLATGVILLALVVFKTKSINKFFAKSTIVLLLLYSLIFISLIYTSSQNYAFEKSFYFGTNIVAFLFPVLNYKSFNFDLFFKSTIFLSLTISILYFFGTNVLDTVLTDYLIVAQLFQIALVLAVLQKENILKYFAIIIFSVSILLLGARAIILTSALIPVLLLSKQFKIKFKHVAIISVFMIILLANFQTILKPLFQYSMDRLFLLADFTGDVSAMERVSQYQFVIEHYINEPSKYLHGYGFGSFGQEYFNKDIRSHPHNLFLETLFELGFLGFMVLLTFLFVVFRKFSKTYWKNDKTYRILCVVLILLFINAMKSSSLDGQRDLFCFVALFLLKTYHLKYNVDVAPLT